MTQLQPGDPAPDFTLPGTDGPVRLSELLAVGPVVLAFYQEADTPTCRSQLTAFRDDYELLAESGVRLLAISTDPLDVHRAFAGRLAAPFPLLSDVDGAVARAYDVYDEAERRARRALFVIDPDGRVRLAIRHYNPANSAQYESVYRSLGLGE